MVLSEINHLNLPEKYFENCITYNILNYFNNKLGFKLFPFSISQNMEHKYGFDFGYKYIDDFFAIQYKKPIYVNNIAKWAINIDQLKTILSMGLGKKVYYCFPDFNRVDLWYLGLDYSFFTRADRLYTYLNNTRKKSVKKDDPIVQNWSETVNDGLLGLKKEHQTILSMLDELKDNNLYNILSQIAGAKEELIIFSVLEERDERK
ncbi:hypothetical protein [Paenibacillus sp. FSL M7-0420]|uniref:hypothetical protein n=1 Tax=Paenibacillus sp. FSL M7-0420 TaxID=2921609 RepID=UPI0030F787BC